MDHQGIPQYGFILIHFTTSAKILFARDHILQFWVAVNFEGTPFSPLLRVGRGVQFVCTMTASS